MRLRLPLPLRCAVLTCLSVMMAVTTATGTITNGENIVFCGDSITQAAGINGAGGTGYRYQVFKNFVDNNITYNPVGSNASNAGGAGATPNYGGLQFDQRNEGHSGWKADVDGVSGGSSIANGIPGWTKNYDAKNVFIMAGTNDILHMNNTTAPDTATVVARIQKCIDGYLADVPDAKIYVSAILPETGSGSGNWNGNVAAYNKRVREINEALAALAREKGYTYVESDKGWRLADDGATVPQNVFSHDNIHPNAQGELLMAGNIARALGVGQRSAGLTRKAASGLAGHLSMTALPTTGMHGKAWSMGKNPNTFVVSSNGTSFYEQSWTGSNLTNGYTCDLSLQMFASNTVNNTFSLKLGNGTTSGLLNLGADRVSWGTTILYVGVNTNEVSDYRVVFHPGDTANGITSGYYVWRNGVLIGEALQGAAGSLNGLQAGGMEGSVLAGLTGLSWDTTGAFAPNYSGVAGADAKGTERLTGFTSLDAPVVIPDWQVMWPEGTPSAITAATAGDIKTAINNLTGTPKNAKITGTFTSVSAGSSLISDSGNAYVELAGTWVNTITNDGKYLNLISGGSYSGNFYFKVGEGGRITTGTAEAPGTAYQGALLGINGGSFTGNLYMEFASSTLTIEGRTLISGQPTAVVGAWGTNTQNLNGSVTMVFKDGTFGFSGNTGLQGAIIAGGYNGAGVSSTITGSTYVQIDGGTFYGSIIGGGNKGNVATGASGSGTNILIKGGTISGNIYGGSSNGGNVGTTEFANGTSILIDGSNVSAAHPLSISGNIYGGNSGTGIVYGNTLITLSNFDQTKLASFAAGTTFNGGAQGTGSVMGSKDLVLDNVKGNLANALKNFDRIVVKNGSDVSLTHADSATALQNVVFSGDGTLALKVAGTYQYALAHTGGKAIVDASSSGVVSNIILGKANAGNTINMGSLKLTTGSISFDVGSGGTSSGFDTLSLEKMTSTGQVDIRINAWQSFLTPGEYALITGDLSGVSSFALTTPSTSARQQWELVYENGKLTLLVTGEPARDLTWNSGASGIWQTGSSTPWNDGTGASSFEQGDKVTFSVLDGVQNSVITLSGNLAPSLITVSGDGTNYTFEGAGAIMGSSSLLKQGDCTLTISNSNNYSGGTVIEGGALIANAVNALGTTGSIRLNSGGTLQLNADNALGSTAGRLVFNGGTFKYGTAMNQDISGLMAASAAGNDNTARIDTNGNNVSWAAFKSGYALVKSGEGTLTLVNTGAVTYAGAFEVQQGALGFNTGANATLSGVLSGSGTLVKQGTGSISINNNTSTFTGVLNVQQGMVVLGGTAGNVIGSGSVARIGTDASSIVVDSGATFRTNFSQNTVTAPGTFSSGVYLKSGATLSNGDGHIIYAGGIHFNVATLSDDLATITYNSSGSSTLHQHWGKNVQLNGVIAGSGTVNVTIGVNNGDHRFILRNAGNTFNGTYDITPAFQATFELATTDVVDGTGLVTGGVAKDASFNLGNGNANLVISGASVTIAGLNSVTGSNITAEGGARTLNLADRGLTNTIGGTFGAAANALTLNKKGVGTLVFTGTNNGTINVQEGVLQLGNTAAYTMAGNVSVGGNGSLNIGGSGRVSTVTMGNLALDDGSHFQMDIVGTTADQLVYTGTAALSGAHTFDLLLSGVTAAGTYTLLTSAVDFGATFSLATWTPTIRGMQGSLGIDGKTVKLTITSAGAASTLVWGGSTASSIWEERGASTNWTGGAADDNHFFQADIVQFTDAAANKTVSIKGAVNPGSILVNNSAGNDYIFNSDATTPGAIVGAGGLTKNGTGTLKINTSNTGWNGAVLLNAGTIEFIKNGLGSGAITMENGTALVWAAGNDLSVGTITANGDRVQLNSGANTITGSQKVIGSYTNLEKLGSGSMNLSLSGNGTHTLTVTGGTTTVSFFEGNGYNTSYYVGNGATLRMDSGFETTAGKTGTTTLAGGTLDLLARTNTYFGGSRIDFIQHKGIITGTSASQWRLAGGTGDTVVAFSVAAEASGSIISVGQLTFTRNTGGAVRFTVADGTEAADLTITSVLNGDGRLQKMGTGTLLLTGQGEIALALDEGKFQIGNAAGGNTNGTWTGAITMAAGSELIIDKTDDLALGGTGSVIAGAGTISILNSGKVTLSNANHTFGGNLNLSGGGTLDLAGKALGAGAGINITNGNLANAGAFGGTVSIDQSKAAAPGNVNLGGASGNRLASFVGAVDNVNDRATTVTNIGGGTITMNGAQTLGIASGMVSSTAGGGIFSFAEGAKGSLAINGNLTLALTDAAATALINGSGSTQYINLTNGTLTLGQNAVVDFKSPYHIFQNIFKFGKVTGGSLSLDAKDASHPGWIICSANDPAITIDGSNSDILDDINGIYNDGTINLAADAGNLTLTNLEGASAQGVINTSGGTTVTLSNDGIASSVYHGTINGDANIIVKGDTTVRAGSGYDFTVGRLNLTNGASLTVDGASLTLNSGVAGTSSTIDGDLNLTNSGRLILSTGYTATVNGTILSDSAADSILLNAGSVLNLGNGFALNTVIDGKGTLGVLDGTFSLGANGRVGNGITLAIGDHASALLGDGDNVGGLSGGGNVQIKDGETLTLQDATATFNGTLTGNNGVIDHAGTGVQTIDSAGNQTFTINQTGSGTTVLRHTGGTAQYDTINADGGILQIEGATSVQNTGVGANGHLIIGGGFKDGVYSEGSSLTSANTSLAAGGTISLGGITQANTGTTQFHAGQVTHTGEGTTSINLGSIGDWTGTQYTINLMDGTGINAGDYDAALLGALKNLGFVVKSVIEENGTLKAVVESSGNNGFLALSSSHNTAQAANSLWNARFDNPDEGGTLRSIINAIRDSGSGVEGTLSSQEATSAMASYAGSSVTTLLASQRDNLSQQVRYIRNRATQMGVNPDYVNADMPYFNAWVQGNGSYNSIQQSGDEAGYTLSSWGGTAGVDIDVSDSLTLGAAFTASYNKLQTRAFDTADGRNDAYYVNLFARMQSKKWAHTLILTGGWNDAKLDRTVNIGSTAYHANGTTTGSTWGAFYEGTYDFALNENRTTVFQPLFNASLYHAQMDGYTETGMGDASMRVSDLKATYGSLGLGGRLMGIVGTNIFGRGALGEVRAQVVQDYGDRTNTATLCPIGAPSAGMSVLGAKVGRTGVQIGAGLTVPVGQNSSIYTDVDADFRSHATVLSGNLGFRYNF